MRRVHPGRGLPAEGRRRRGETTVVFGKPRETVGQQNYGTKVKGSFPMLCSPGCNLANHGKLWDAKPEAWRGVRAVPVRLRGKSAETLRRKTRG